MSTWSEWDRCPPGTALREADPEIARLIERETERQTDGLELIASENFVSPAVLEAMGSPLTNKYAEGLAREALLRRLRVRRPGRAARDRPREGSCSAPTTRTCSRTPARRRTAAVFLAFLKPGDTFLGMDLSHGGHLTHGSPVNFSGMLYQRGRVRRERRRAASTTTQMRSAGARAPAEDDHRRRQRVSARHRLRARSPRSRRRSARSSWWTWRTSRGSSRRACIRRRCRTPTSSRRRRTRRCAARAAGLILCKARAREGDRQGGVPRHAGRPARARHRREGGRASRRRSQPSFKQYCGAGRRERAALAGGARRARLPARVRRHRQPPHARRPAQQGPHRQGRRAGARSRRRSR